MSLDDYSDEDYVIEYEMANVDIGIGTGFEHTSELKVMQYEEEMRLGPKGWIVAVEEEHQRML